VDYYGKSAIVEKWKGMDVTYSCDKMVVSGQFAYNRIDHVLKYIWGLRHYGSGERYAPWGYKLEEVSFYEKVSLMAYRNNFVFEFWNEAKEKVSFYFAVGFNGVGGISEVWKLEFNPNKILSNVAPWFCEFLLVLRENSRVGGMTNSVEVKSFDLAIDFPVSRDCVLYNRGNRGHTMFLRSYDDRTDYYGEAGKHGRTKVYNKAKEAGLDRDLTRLEVTLKLDDFDSVRKYFEGLSVMTSRQMQMVDAPRLSASDRLTLELLSMHPEYLERFPYRDRKKYTPYMQDFLVPFELSRKAFGHVVGWMSSFTKLDIAKIFDDD
jgi:hypothetical protein